MAAPRPLVSTCFVFALLLPVVGFATAIEPDPGPGERLRTGHGTLDDVRRFGDGFDGGYELSERDVDCDGEAETLVELAQLRGATGNRGYEVFDRLPTGFIHRGRISGISAVLDYPEGGCYLVTYSVAGAGHSTLNLSSTRGGAIRGIGHVEMTSGDGATEEDALLAGALFDRRLSEEGLQQVFRDGTLRRVEVDESRRVPYVEKTVVDRRAADETRDEPGNGVRLIPERVTPNDEWARTWGNASPRLVRTWAAAVEEATRGEAGKDLPGWLRPAPGAAIEIDRSLVSQAIRLTRLPDRGRVGVIVGRFGTVGQETKRGRSRDEVDYAAILEVNEFGEPLRIVKLFVRPRFPHRSHRRYELERITNLDDDDELEVILEEELESETDRWHVLHLLDISSPEGLAIETERRVEVAVQPPAVPPEIPDDSLQGIPEDLRRDLVAFVGFDQAPASAGAIDCRIWVPEGRFSGACRFAEPADRVIVPTGPRLAGLEEVTVSVWVEPGEVTQDAHVVSRSDGQFALFLQKSEGAGYWRFLARQLGGHALWIPIGAVRAKPGWTHLVGTFDQRGELLLYENGRAAPPDRAKPGPLAESDTPLVLGVKNDGSYPFRGLVDEVAIFGRALDPREVKSLHEWQRGEKKPGRGEGQSLSKPDGAPSVYVDETGLAWTTRDDGRPRAWMEAEAWCRDLRLGGFDNWRLPTIDEIPEIYDSSLPNEGPKIRSPIRFSAGGSVIWSGTRKNRHHGWVYDFYTGKKYDEDVDRAPPFVRVLCVRRAGG